MAARAKKENEATGLNQEHPVHENQLSDLTLNYLEGRPKSERSPIGQFITPKLLRDRLLSQIEIKPGFRVLDPGVGTGEFLKSSFDVENDIYLEGWDVDEPVLKVAKKLIPSAKLKLQSALEQPWREDFDVVIGNPPYFEMRHLDPLLKAKYKNVIGGRPNIFSLFFAAGLGALKPGGTLGFVVPPSMNNGAFFSKLRTHIRSKASIEFLELYEENNLFLEVQTAVQLIVLRKGKTSKNFILDLGEIAKTPESRVVFCENPKKLEKEFNNRSTLWNLGYEAVTGTLVWNKNKSKLHVQRVEGTVPLLWAHNVTDNDEVVLKEDNTKKPQYVEINQALVGPAIIVNRITGSVGNGSLRCALVPTGFSFVGENHVNVIRARKNFKQLISMEELLDLLRHDGINKRVQLLTGNTQLSCVELTNWLPLDTNMATSNKISASELDLAFE